MAGDGGLIRATRESADAIAIAIGNLRIDPSAMRQNLGVRGGVAMAEALSIALMAHVSRSDAMTHVERLCRIAEREMVRCEKRPRATRTSRGGCRPPKSAVCSPQRIFWAAPGCLSSAS